MDKVMLAITILVAAFVVVMASASVALAGYIVGDEPGWLDISPCATEDSENCYWDADERGNGTGRSFIRWDGTTYYEEDMK